MNHLEGDITYIGDKSYESTTCIQTLKKKGYSIFYAEKYRPAKNTNLIILDTKACICFAKSRKNKIADNIPVIALLKHSWNHRRSFFQFKINDYILTPIIPEEVIHRVEVNLFYYYCARPYHTNTIDTDIIDQGKSRPLSPNNSRNEINLTVKTCKYLLKNLSKQQSLDSISKHMGTNRSKLAASFKSTLGISVFQWLRHQRLIKANVLIRKTEDSIKNIALEVGYTNFSHFSTAYKAYFNGSPMMERKNIRNQK